MVEIQTDWGKAYLHSAAYRRCHPAGSTGVYGLETSSGTDALWIICINQTYFDAGGNPSTTHGTLGAMDAATSGCVFGYSGAHSTSTPWYTGNAILQNSATIPAPVYSTPGQSVMALPSGITITFQAAATYPMAIGGIAICSTNTANATNAVHTIAAFTGGVVNVASATSTLSLTGGSWTLTEPA